MFMYFRLPAGTLIQRSDVPAVEHGFKTIAEAIMHAFRHEQISILHQSVKFCNPDLFINPRTRG
jgi:hypothetical protein